MGTDNKVQGHSHTPTWDDDIIYFFIFSNFLRKTVKKQYKNKTRFCSVPLVAV